MLRLWRWAFARMYIQQRRWWGEARNPALPAAFGLGMVVFFQATALVFIVASWLGTMATLEDYMAHAGLACLLMAYAAYHQFETKRRAAKLIKKLSRQSWDETLREERLLWCYIVGSLALPLVIGLVSGLAARR